MEGGMKDLSPDILNAVDVDIPADTLTWTSWFPQPMAHWSMAYMVLRWISTKTWTLRSSNELQQSSLSPYRSYNKVSSWIHVIGSTTIFFLLTFGVPLSACWGQSPFPCPATPLCLHCVYPGFQNRCCRRQRSQSACGASASSAKSFQLLSAKWSHRAWGIWWLHSFAC